MKKLATILVVLFCTVVAAECPYTLICETGGSGAAFDGTLPTGTTGSSGLPSLRNATLAALGVNLDGDANAIGFNYNINGKKYNFSASRLSILDSGNFTFDINFDIGISRKDTGIWQINNGIVDSNGAGFQLFRRDSPPAACDEGLNGTLYFDSSDAFCICMDSGGVDGWQKVFGDGTCS